MRIAFTIIFNGLHHLTHNDYYNKILNNFDYWVVVEGASKSNGSTYWCKDISDKYQNNGASVDGTIEFLSEIKSDKLIFIKSNGFWDSKDVQVNRAIFEVKKITNNCFLWEIDIDEQWELENIILSEKELFEKGGKTGKFFCEYYVGKSLIAKGDWGEGPYNRLWDWKGEFFATHEPPILQNGNGLSIDLTPRFKHYSYYFEKDVIFKNDWYGGHENILNNWTNLQKEENFPVHISYLISGNWGKTNTYIYKSDEKN